MAVQSALGETLNAEIDVTSLTAEEEANLNVQVASPDAYRAAGVDYNSVLPGTQVVLLRRSDGRHYFRVTSDNSVQEPFVDLILEISWTSGRLVREYTLLFDPPASTNMAQAAPTPAVSPSISTARNDRDDVVPPKPTDRKSGKSKAVVADTAASIEQPKSLTSDSDTEAYKVRSGDSLSRIASKNQRPGVSLDQMLVSLYQNNPQAFRDNNMNRLKAGVVLSIPSVEKAKALTTAAARKLIQAQSADFAAYRQRLAGEVPGARSDGASRQVTGTVQADVEDRKLGTGQAPDKLTLSKAASAPEDRVSREREKKDAAARVAELAKNVEELKKLSGTPQAADGEGVQSGGASTSQSGSVAVPIEPPVSVPDRVAAPDSGSAPGVVSEPASAPESIQDPIAVAPENSGEAASAPTAAPASDAASAPEAAAAEPMMWEDNPLALAVGGGLIALLLGYGVFRFTKRTKKDSGETSFLESRLQPDSFFGASGGQRIDTRDAAGASSSMSYSLSQLDAIGDVDPVAEADVYLAYGRDLQAEEILKEAMRSSPERLAIRTKLLEVYAKRRDVKGVEVLATQLYGLTGGQGEDWAKTQEIGLQVDPQNTLYQPGSAPAGADHVPTRQPADVGPSTLSQPELSVPSEFSTTPDSGFDISESSLDLDLDLGLSDLSSSSFSKQASPPSSKNRPQGQGVSFEISGESGGRASSHSASPGNMDLGLNSSLNFDLGQTVDATQAQGAPSEFRNSGLGEGDDADPIERKLELAEEFRQIGDKDGARDLLQEVVAKASGSVKLRAETMLRSLG